MNKYILSVLFALFTVVEGCDARTAEQKEDDESGLWGIGITLVILFVAYCNDKQK